MWRRKRGWILLICLSIEGVPETSEGHPVLANRKAGLSSRKQQLKHSWRRYKKWKLLPLLFELAFMNCQFRWEISLLGNGWSNLNDFRPPWISNSDQMLKMCKKSITRTTDFGHFWPLPLLRFSVREIFSLGRETFKTCRDWPTILGANLSQNSTLLTPINPKKLQKCDLGGPKIGQQFVLPNFVNRAIKPLCKIFRTQKTI